MAKMIAFDQEARDAMRRGVSKLARAVKVTTGSADRSGGLPWAPTDAAAMAAWGAYARALTRSRTRRGAGTRAGSISAEAGPGRPKSQP